MGHLLNSLLLKKGTEFSPLEAFISIIRILQHDSIIHPLPEVNILKVKSRGAVKLKHFLKR